MEALNTLVDRVTLQLRRSCKPEGGVIPVIMQLDWEHESAKHANFSDESPIAILCDLLSGSDCPKIVNSWFVLYLLPISSIIGRNNTADSPASPPDLRVRRLAKGGVPNGNPRNM
jgi:hypothetical protein